MTGLESSRTFDEIREELALRPLIPTDTGTLYITPNTARLRFIVRHFDFDRGPALVIAYQDLLAAVHQWIADRPPIAKLLSCEPPGEIGVDFVARSWHLFSHSLKDILDPTHPDEALEVPAEFEELSGNVRAEIRKTCQHRWRQIVESVVERSLLMPAGKTYFSHGSFVLLEPKFSRKDLEDWAKATGAV